jgi:hypothetical protein
MSDPKQCAPSSSSTTCMICLYPVETSGMHQDQADKAGSSLSSSAGDFGAALPDTGLFHTPCGHVFHTVCVQPWIDQTNSCPTCRAAIEVNQPTRLLLPDTTGDEDLARQMQDQDQAQAPDQEVELEALMRRLQEHYLALHLMQQIRDYQDTIRAYRMFVAESPSEAAEEAADQEMPDLIDLTEEDD